MSSKDIKELKKIIKDPVFKNQSSKLVDCSVKIFAKKFKGIIKFGAKTLISLIDESGSESNSDSDSELATKPESKLKNCIVPYPEVELGIDDYNKYKEWKDSPISNN